MFIHSSCLCDWTSSSRDTAPVAAVSQLRVLLSVLLDRFLEIPTMQQGQCHQAASEAGVHCTDEMTQRLLSRHRLGCFLCPAKDTKPTAGSEALVTPGMQTNPF